MPKRQKPITPISRIVVSNAQRGIGLTIDGEARLDNELLAASGMLNIYGWVQLGVVEGTDSYRIEAECPADHVACPHCQSDNVYSHGWRWQDYADLPIHHKSVVIQVKRRRYKCLDCGKTFQQRLYEMEDGQLMTRRLAYHIKRQSLKSKFADVAREVGVSEALVRLMFIRHTDELEAKRQIITPEWLGIDEVYVTRRMRAVFTDVKERRPVELLSDRKKGVVAAFLRTLDKKRVKVVTMDMWNPYRDAVQETFPEARIIVDRFHVVKLANQMMENVRKRTRSQLTDKRRRQLKGDRYILLRRRGDLSEQQRFILDTWIQNYQELGNAYTAKEMFCDIWEFDTREYAVAHYAYWLQWIENVGVKDDFAELVRAMNNWFEEVFAYFDSPATNAYTEAFNRILKETNYVGRGHTFRTIRAKMLYGRD